MRGYQATFAFERVLSVQINLTTFTSKSLKMKRLITLTALVLLGTFAFAQQAFVIVSGYVTHAQTGYAIPGQPMYITVDSLNYPGYTSVVFTNDNGYYTDSIPLSPNTTQGMVMVSTSNCDGSMATATAGFYPGLGQIVLNFSICGNSTSGCMAMFNATPLANDILTYAFTDESTANPGSAINSWYWDFGDGSSSSEQNPVHSYNEPGLYNVCLFISSIDSSCYSSFCMLVDAGSTLPGDCENYFWYQPDSLGGFAFTGYLFNGQADTYLWDFGDGSTGSGQFVTHSFADPSAVYTVCLTTTGSGISGDTCTAVSCQDVFNYTPSPCESSFWYYPDSTGNTFTFQGYAMNAQMLEWQWDFGDGSTASGQAVTHTFTGTNSIYNVCLTTTGTNPAGEPCTYISCQDVFIYVPSPCENYFNAYTNDGLTYTFDGYVLSGAPASYVWNFGDGSTGNGPQISHTFQPNGQVFYVCLTTFTGDPASNDTCSSTSCQVIIPGGGGGGCQAMMTAVPDSSSYTWYFADVSATAHAFRFWDFGDGSTSTAINPSHTYTQPGMYLACLAISDSMNFCYDQTCMEIWVDVVQPGCQASFIAVPADPTASSLTYMFINTSSPGFTGQQWSFGDGTGSMEAMPVHTYTQPGTYTACLTIWDSTGNCQSTACQQVYAGDAPGNFTIGGIVTAGNTLGGSGQVWLIGYDNTWFAETTIDSMGMYIFNNVPEGMYYIYAMLTPDSPLFFNYLPTYYQSSLTWQGATAVPTGEPNEWYVINLLPSAIWGTGPGNISGSINWSGNFKSGGTPAGNVEIVLFNSSGLPIAYTFSLADGSFEFSNLPYGEYTLHAEMTGMTTQAATVILTGTSATATVNFVASGTEISAALGINDPELQHIATGNPYPNPVKDNLLIDLNAGISGSCLVEILDLQGRILSRDSKTLAGKTRLEISTSGLPGGMYLLKISSDGYQPIQRKFVK